jgi:hypothetical protein
MLVMKLDGARGASAEFGEVGKHERVEPVRAADVALQAAEKAVIVEVAEVREVFSRFMTAILHLDLDGLWEPLRARFRSSMTFDAVWYRSMQRRLIPCESDTFHCSATFSSPRVRKTASRELMLARSLARVP